MNKVEKWDRRYILLADHIAQWSEDRSTKVGAVIVSPRNRIVSVGYNGFPTGVDQTIDERHERPTKYNFFSHGEMNAILNAGRELHDCALYLNYAPAAVCSDCARAIIQCGITTVIGPDRPFPGSREQWDSKFEATREMFDEAEIVRITHKMHF